MGKLIMLILCVFFGCKAMNAQPRATTPEAFVITETKSPPKVRSPLCDCGDKCNCNPCLCNTVPQEPKVPATKPEAKIAPAKDSPKVAPSNPARPQQQPAAGRWEYKQRWIPTGRFGRGYWQRDEKPTWVPVRSATGYKPLPRAVNC